MRNRGKKIGELAKAQLVAVIAFGRTLALLLLANPVHLIAQELPPPHEETTRVPPITAERTGTQLLRTNSLDFVPKGTLQVGVSVDYLNGVFLPFSGLGGDLTRYGTLRADIGFGDHIEVQVRGIIDQTLSIDTARSNPSPELTLTSDRTSDVGDFALATLARLTEERRHLPAFGMRVEAKLPNTNQNKGIGTNTTDVLLSVLTEKHAGRLSVFSDIGLGILTEPTVPESQDDVVIYGLAATGRIRSHFTLMGEVNGRWAPSGFLPGTEDHSQIRAGGAFKHRGFTCELLFTHGLTRFDEDYGISLGASWMFRARQSVYPG